MSSTEVVAIVASAGGISAISEILSCLPAGFPVPILCLQHITSDQSALAEVLGRRTALKVRWAQQGERLTAGTVYLCPAHRCFVVRPEGTVSLAQAETRSEWRHQVDLFLDSLAMSYGRRAVVIVLTGAGSYGSEGVRAVYERHGTVLIQDQASAWIWGMPKAALATGCVDGVLPLEEIAPTVVSLVRDGRPFVELGASNVTLQDRMRMLRARELRDALDRLPEILLVEDNPDDVELTLHSLRQNKLANRIQVARDGEEALDYLFSRGVHRDRVIEGSPKLVLLDLKLPKVDGLEVLRAIKGDRRTSVIPVVVLSSSRENKDLAESYHLGVNSYIQKPVEFKEFRETVSQLGLYWLLVNQPPRANDFWAR